MTDTNGLQRIYLIGGDEGDLNIHFSEPLESLQRIENNYEKINQNTHSEPLIATRVQVRTATKFYLLYKNYKNKLFKIKLIV